MTRLWACGNRKVSGSSNARIPLPRRRMMSVRIDSRAKLRVPRPFFLQRQGNVVAHVKLRNVLEFGASAVRDLERQGAGVAE